MNQNVFDFRIRIQLALGLAAVLSVGSAFAQEVKVTVDGVETTLTSVPQRVAVFDQASLDTLIALGATDAVVAVPKPADRPANFASFLSIYAADRFLPAGTVFEPDLAALRAIGPDLIIVGGRSRSKLAEVSAIAPAIDLSTQDSDPAASAIRTTETLGHIFGLDERAAEINAEFEDRVTALREHAASAGTAVLIFAAGEVYSTQPPGSRFGGVYELVGIPSVMAPAEPSSGSRPAAGTPEAEAARARQQESTSDALAADPDWIFTIDRNSAFGDRTTTLPERLAADPEVTATTAWKKGQVVHLDGASWYLIGGTGYHALTGTIDLIDTAFTEASLGISE